MSKMTMTLTNQRGAKEVFGSSEDPPRSESKSRKSFPANLAQMSGPDGPARETSPLLGGPAAGASAGSNGAGGVPTGSATNQCDDGTLTSPGHRPLHAPPDRRASRYDSLPSHRDGARPDDGGEQSRCRGPVTGSSYFYPPGSSVQRYYRFESTPLTPMIALYRRPLEAYPDGAGCDGTTAGGDASGLPPAGPGDRTNTTGLLTRSMVLPSHGTDPTGRWVLVSVGGRSGWARRSAPAEDGGGGGGAGSSAGAEPPSFRSAPSFRGGEAWTGNHVFLCGGRAMLGSDAPLFYVTNLLLAAGAALHFGLVLPHLMRRDGDGGNGDDGDSMRVWTTHSAAVITSAVACLAAVLSLWKTALTDPGIIPPNPSPDRPPPPPDSRPAGGRVPMGGPLGYRYCQTCNVYRPPRSKHCNSCNVCVASFDHHCPWVGTAIGGRNYASFVSFLVSLCVLTFVVTASCVRIVAAAYRDTVRDSLDLEDDDEVFDDYFHDATRFHVRLLLATVSRLPVEAAFGLFAAMCTWSLTSLALFHFVIISAAQTTNERVRGVYQYGGVPNPNDRGCVRNWLEFLRGGAGVPSRIPRDLGEVVLLPADGDTGRPRTEETVWPGWGRRDRAEGMVVARSDQQKGERRLVTSASGGGDGGADNGGEGTAATADDAGQVTSAGGDGEEEADEGRKESKTTDDADDAPAADGEEKV